MVGGKAWRCAILVDASLWWLGTALVKTAPWLHFPGLGKEIWREEVKKQQQKTPLPPKQMWSFLTQPEDSGTQSLSIPSPAPPTHTDKTWFCGKIFIAAIPMVDHSGLELVYHSIF